MSLSDSIASGGVILVLFHDLIQLIKDLLKIGARMPIMVHTGLCQILHLQQGQATASRLSGTSGQPRARVHCAEQPAFSCWYDKESSQRWGLAAAISGCGSLCQPQPLVKPAQCTAMAQEKAHPERLGGRFW